MTRGLTVRGAAWAAAACFALYLLGMFVANFVVPFLERVVTPIG